MVSTEGVAELLLDGPNWAVASVIGLIHCASSALLFNVTR